MKRTLESDMLVIADASAPQAVAGVMVDVGGTAEDGDAGVARRGSGDHGGEQVGEIHQFDVPVEISAGDERFRVRREPQVGILRSLIRTVNPGEMGDLT